MMLAIMGGLAVHRGDVVWEVHHVAHDSAQLERKVRDLQEAVKKLHTAEHADRLLAIIHRPGWTTPAESELVMAHVDSLQSRATDLHKACDALLAAAEKVGKAR